MTQEKKRSDLDFKSIKYVEKALTTSVVIYKFS